MNPNDIAADIIEAEAARLMAKANKLRMGNAWSKNPDDIKPELKVVK